MPGVCAGGGAGAEGTINLRDTAMRVAISDQVLRGVNRNDASAAMSVWAEELSKATGLKLAKRALVESSDAVLAAMRAGELDVACLTIPEYRRMAPYLDIARVLTAGSAEMWLMVSEASGITKLSGLAGRSLLVHDSPYTLLADDWLAVSLAKEGLGRPGKVLAKMTRLPRAAQCILPVFFGQADACLAQRRTFETMAEMNPQLGRKLKPLLTSEKMVGAFLACRKDNPPQLKWPLLDVLASAKDSVAAKHVMTLFHEAQFVAVDGEVLRPALRMMEAAERLPPG